MVENRTGKEEEEKSEKQGKYGGQRERCSTAKQVFPNRLWLMEDPHRVKEKGVKRKEQQRNSSALTENPSISFVPLIFSLQGLSVTSSNNKPRERSLE